MATTTAPAHSLALLSILASVLVTSYGSPQYHYNKKYFSSPYPIHGYKPGHRYPNPNYIKPYRFNNGLHKRPHLKTRAQQYLPYSGEVSHVGLTNSYQDDRKSGYYHKHGYLNSSKPGYGTGSRKRASLENFVTRPPPVEPETSPRKKKNTYEVTTKFIDDIEPTVRPPVHSLGLGDRDIPLALDDDEEVGVGVNPVKGRRRPEHLNPLVYVDSYGRVHRRPELESAQDAAREYGLEDADYGQGAGQSYGYGVLHRPPSHYKKPAGRVKMQVFRGRTRKIGHKKYAPWGFYVVQPAESSSPQLYNNHHY